jgi:hypothetical protein
VGGATCGSSIPGAAALYECDAGLHEVGALRRSALGIELAPADVAD